MVNALLAALALDGASLALYEDLRKLVDAQMRRTWFVDRIELQEGANQALRSVCQTPESARAVLKGWLEARVTALGGAPRVQFTAGRSLADLDEVLRIDRVRMQLEHAEQSAAQDCPFWLPARVDFAGVQGDAGRFVLLLETLGGGQVFLTRRPLEFGGGGGVRLMPAYGVSRRWTLAAGFETGGASTLPSDDNGQRRVDLGLAVAAPVMARYQRSTFFFDTEVAWTRRADEFDFSESRNGVRGVLAAGLSEIRLASFMPYAGVWVGYEWLPAEDTRGAEHVLRAGTKFGIDWDFSR